MVVQHNISAMNANRNLAINVNNTAKSMEKLSSGFQINRAADDAAGLAISEKMRGQIRGLDKSVKNAQDGISLIQTAEGALNESQDIVQRIRELGIQSSNGTNTSEDRGYLQLEVGQLTKELDRIATTTQFNKKNLLDGSIQTISFHVGPNSASAADGGTVSNNSPANRVTMTLGAMASGNIFTGTTTGKMQVSFSGVDVSTYAGAQATITFCDKGLRTISQMRANFGAMQNRLEHTVNNLNVANENLSSAESRIRDTDMAGQMMDYTKNNILQQAAQTMLSHANQNQQSVLQLLQ